MVFAEKNKYLAIIGDIKKSRQLEERKKVQVQLNDVLTQINQKYKEQIASKFLITLGDEFQGLLLNGSQALTIVEELKRKMYPIEIRFGIGVGEITTKIDREKALGADGPSYYYARNAIEQLKKNENRSKRISADIRIEMSDESRGILLNTIFELLKALEDTWTDRQREIIQDMLQHQDGQKNVADRFGIYQSAVQKVMVAGNYYTYENALENVQMTLEELWND